MGPIYKEYLGATRELLMISGTCDKLRISAIYKESYEKLNEKDSL